MLSLFVAAGQQFGRMYNTKPRSIGLLDKSNKGGNIKEECYGRK